MPDKDQERRRWSDDKLEQFYNEFKAHAEAEDQQISRFIKAFSNDDPIAHRQYHDAVIRAAEAQEKFWNELRLDVAKKSLWGVITLIVGLILAGGAMKMGLKP